MLCVFAAYFGWSGSCVAIKGHCIWYSKATRLEIPAPIHGIRCNALSTASSITISLRRSSVHAGKFIAYDNYCAITAKEHQQPNGLCLFFWIRNYNNNNSSSEYACSIRTISPVGKVRRRKSNSASDSENSPTKKRSARKAEKSKTNERIYDRAYFMHNTIEDLNLNCYFALQLNPPVFE